MIDFQTIRQGGYTAIKNASYALTWTSTAGPLLIKASTDTKPVWPDDALFCVITIRTAGITVSYDGETPTAAAIGHDYGVPASQAPYSFPLCKDAALQAQAIAISGSPTGYVTFFKF